LLVLAHDGCCKKSPTISDEFVSDADGVDYSEIPNLWTIVRKFQIVRLSLQNE